MSSQVWTRTLIAIAGLLGFAGVAVGAAGAHSGGGDLTRLASTFFLVHAAAICGIAALHDNLGRGSALCRGSAAILAVGTALFAGDVAAVDLAGRHLLSGLAPTGGSLLLVGWALLAASPIYAAIARDQDARPRR